MNFTPCSSEFCQPESITFLSHVLDIWRYSGSSAAHELLLNSPPHPGLLYKEILLRTSGQPGPRILVDTIWLSRDYGGVSRVWQQILHTFGLPQLFSSLSPLAITNPHPSSSIIPFCSYFPPLHLDPLNLLDSQRSSAYNHYVSLHWKPDIFLSSWLTTSSIYKPSAREIVLVHDCIPELSTTTEPSLLSQRSTCFARASATLSVSQTTHRYVTHITSRDSRSSFWCHPSFPSSSHVHSPTAETSLQSPSYRFQPYILLPGTSSIGSYKNPEVLGQALSAQSLLSLNLVITGLNAEVYAEQLLLEYPLLRDRVFPLGCTDDQLIDLYQNSFATVIPSRIEGFGLPVLEALSTHTPVLISKAPGLLEAASGSPLTFSPSHPSELISLLELLLHKPSRAWLLPLLKSRANTRLRRQPHPDFLALCLLSLARLYHSPTSSSRSFLKDIHHS